MIKLIAATLLIFLGCVDIALSVPKTDKQLPDSLDKDVLSGNLVGGRRARDGELPFSVFIQNCTASIVGPEVVLTAGHCRDSGDRVVFNLNGVRHEGRCAQHPQFNNRTLNNDFALCKFSPALSDSSIFASLEPKRVNRGDDVVIQGFGETDFTRKRLDIVNIAAIDDQDLFTNDRNTKLGGGDSGGGLIINTDLFKGPFVIVGVNSRVQINGQVSFFNRVNLDRSQQFFKDFARANNVEICGVTENCEGEDPPPPNNDCDAEQDIVDFFAQELENAKEVLRECLER